LAKSAVVVPALPRFPPAVDVVSVLPRSGNLRPLEPVLHAFPRLSLARCPEPGPPFASHGITPERAVARGERPSAHRLPRPKQRGVSRRGAYALLLLLWLGCRPQRLPLRMVYLSRRSRATNAHMRSTIIPIGTPHSGRNVMQACSSVGGVW
jgi:hypothetical protein